jgi:tetratricopeptide (TPR) repeat protein
VALKFQGEYLRAFTDDTKARDPAPNEPLAIVNRGVDKHELGDDAGALASIKFALKLAPGFQPALDAWKQVGAGKGVAQQAAARPDAAAGGANPPECMMPVADVALDPKSIDRIRQACTDLINSPGGDAEGRSLAFNQRGSMYRRQQKYDLALADFEQAIRYDPTFANA